MNKARAAYLHPLLILLVLSSCGEVPPAAGDAVPAKYVRMPFSFGEVMQAKEAGGLCPVRISFGSECCGIDHDLRQAFDRYLIDEVRVTKVYTQGWGREGEIDYCLEIPKEEDLESVLRKTQGLLNSYGEPKRGYAHITRSAR